MRLEQAAGLGLTGDAVDVGGEDETDADAGADGREAVAEDRDVSGHGGSFPSLDRRCWRRRCEYGAPARPVPARVVCVQVVRCVVRGAALVLRRAGGQCSSASDPAMYRAASSTKMYACRNSTRISKTVMTKAMT